MALAQPMSSGNEAPVESHGPAPGPLLPRIQVPPTPGCCPGGGAVVPPLPACVDLLPKPHRQRVLLRPALSRYKLLESGSRWRGAYLGQGRSPSAPS